VASGRVRAAASSLDAAPRPQVPPRVLAVGDHGSSTRTCAPVQQQGWRADERLAQDLAGQCRRELTDSFGRQANPPWLHTSFVTASK